MANNTILASDNFASGSLAAGWSLAGYATAMTAITASAPYYAEPVAVNTNFYGQIWTGLTWPNDQTSEVTLGNFDTTHAQCYMWLRQTGTAASPSGYILLLFNTQAVVYKVTAAATTAISTTTGLTFAAGDVWAFSAAGSCLTATQNGNRVACIGDATYTSGTPGFILGIDSLAVTNCQIASWRGYSAVQQDGIWQKQGIVLAPNATDLSGIGAYEGCCIYDGNPQLLAGPNVYKLWFSGGASGSYNTFYAESPDLVNWTRQATAVLSGYVTPGIIKNGSTYYMYCQAQNQQGGGNIAYYTSPDGVTWTQQSANVLSLGGSGAWDAGSIYPLKPVAIINGTWYALYGACSAAELSAGYPFKIGLATSTDGAGAVWTKYASNPVLKSPNPTGQAIYIFPCVAQVNGTYYIWFVSGPSAPQNTATSRALDPDETVRYSTTDFVHWAGPVGSIHHSQVFEAVNTPINNTEQVGGNGAIAIFNINGNATMLYCLSQGDGVTPAIAQYAIAVAPAPIAAIVTANEDAVQQTKTDGFTSGVGPLSANWTTLSENNAPKIVSGNLAEPSSTDGGTSAAVFTGASFTTSQYAEITLSALASGGKASPMVLATVGTGTNYHCTLAGAAGSQSFQAQLIRTSTAIGPVLGITPEVGDVIRLSVVQGTSGPVLSMFQNGAMIFQYVDESASALTTGSPGIIQSETSGAGSQISLFAAGNANVIPTYGGSGNSGPGVEYGVNSLGSVGTYVING